MPHHSRYAQECKSVMHQENNASLTRRLSGCKLSKEFLARSWFHANGIKKAKMFPLRENQRNTERVRPPAAPAAQVHGVEDGIPCIGFNS